MERERENMDDTIIGDQTKQEHDENLAAFLKTSAVHANNEKCAYFQEAVNFLGNTIFVMVLWNLMQIALSRF